MIVQTKDQVEKEFRAELRALLNKYGAELRAEDHWIGYAECGSDIKMTVYIPSIYNESGEYVREYVEIDLGNYVDKTN